MAEKERKTINCWVHLVERGEWSLSKKEAETIETLEKLRPFGWKLASIYKTRPREYVDVTVEATLVLERDTSIPNYSELVALEKEYNEYEKGFSYSPEFASLPKKPVNFGVGSIILTIISLFCLFIGVVNLLSGSSGLIIFIILGLLGLIISISRIGLSSKWRKTYKTYKEAYSVYKNAFDASEAIFERKRQDVLKKVEGLTSDDASALMLSNRQALGEFRNKVKS